MAEPSLVEMVRENNLKISRILELLDGDGYMRPGMRQQMSVNTQAISELNRSGLAVSANMKVLSWASWVALPLIALLVYFNNMVLVSEVRIGIGRYGHYAVLLASAIAIIYITLLSLVVIINVLRILGLGRAGA